METSWTLAIVGLLGCLGVSRLDFGGQKLSILRQELQGSLDQAFTLAKARGSDVVVALGHASGQEPWLLPVPLPRGVAWGCPLNVPLPPGMDSAPVAVKTGASHSRITVTPRRTVTAGAWFFHAGKHVLCLRVNGKGRATAFRWQPTSRKWLREG